MFDLGWAVEIRGARWNKSRGIHNLLQKVLVTQEFDFGIEFFFRNVGTGEIHGAGSRGGDDGVNAAAAQQNLEVRFISRREDKEEYRRQQYEPKRSGYESRTPEQRGRKLARRGGKRVARVCGHAVPASATRSRFVWDRTAGDDILLCL